MGADASVLPDRTEYLDTHEVDDMARHFRAWEHDSRSGRGRGDLWWAFMGRGVHAAYDRSDFTDADLRRVMARVEALDAEAAPAGRRR